LLRHGKLNHASQGVNGRGLRGPIRPEVRREFDRSVDQSFPLASSRETQERAGISPEPLANLPERAYIWYATVLYSHQRSRADAHLGSSLAEIPFATSFPD
jgi:hypothetical protein